MGCGARLHPCEVDGLCEKRLDRHCHFLRGRILEVHAPAGPIAIESMPDVEVLLAMVSEWEVDERTAGGGQLHRGAETTLRQCDIACGKVQVEVGDERPHLDSIDPGQGA